MKLKKPLEKRIFLFDNLGGKLALEALFQDTNCSMLSLKEAIEDAENLDDLEKKINMLGLNPSPFCLYKATEDYIKLKMDSHDRYLVIYRR